MSKTKQASDAVKGEPKPLAKEKIDNRSKRTEPNKSLAKFDPLQRYLSEISRYRLLTRT
jgi:hypothetical protein